MWEYRGKEQVERKKLKTGDIVWCGVGCVCGGVCVCVCVCFVQRAGILAEPKEKSRSVRLCGVGCPRSVFARVCLHGKWGRQEEVACRYAESGLGVEERTVDNE